ncbi:MAG: DJ-1/PfpI family protein [Bacteroidales bacterium]|nr:DJ-1/PfpI family protein [Bacteroidales bacterium]
MKGINIFLADGFEDMEALATCDVLRRAGLPVELVSIKKDLNVTSSHGVDIEAEWVLEDMETSAAGTEAWDVMIFPGGMPGSKSLAACKPLIKAMKAHYKAGGTLAAICAAPGLVLNELEDVSGLEFTCFDGFQDALVARGATFTPKPAVRSGRIITGRSAGHAVSFALTIADALLPDKSKVEEVKHGLFLETE